MATPSASHAAPTDGMECMACMEDVDATNYVEYQTEEGGAWKPALFCESCITRLQNSQWDDYVNGLAKATCKAEQRRMLDKGPPINVHDPNAMPCPEKEGSTKSEVYRLWFSSDGQEHSAKLKGSLEGEERQKWWDEKEKFRFKEEDDPSEGGTEGGGTTHQGPKIH